MKDESIDLYLPQSNLPPLPSVDEIKEDNVQQARQQIFECGMFNITSVNKAIKDASERPNPISLWFSLWYEGEVCCLYADSNVGKSLYAIQMATAIAANKRVLYFDFELSDKQFQLRYTDDTGNLFCFPDNLFRVEINPYKMEVGADFETEVIQNIEQAALQLNANVIIVDNLTWLCNASEKGESAGILMKSLMGLKRRYGWSILVIAHTPKRNLSNPITQNDLAGSKKLFNFFDSAFSIGYSAKDDGLRYIKQTKVRSGDLRFHSDNVIVYSVEKIGAFTQFVFKGYATEKEHLKSMGSKEEIALRDAAYQLHIEGKSYRVIAAELNISKSKVERLLKKKRYSVPSVLYVLRRSFVTRHVGQVGTVGQWDSRTVGLTYKIK